MSLNKLLLPYGGNRVKPGLHTTILPTIPVSFRIQSQSSSGRTNSTDPHQGLLRGPAGAEFAENELHRQQVIEAAESETQGVLVVRRNELE